MDLKLEEKIEEIRRNQEIEINNIKRMMTKQMETDLPLQMDKIPSNLRNHHTEEKKVQYNPIRGRQHPVTGQKVPPINLNNPEHV